MRTYEQGETPCTQVMNVLSSNPDATDLLERLRTLFKPEAGEDALCVFLCSPLTYLGLRTPKEVILEGNFRRVECAIEALDSGIFI